MMPTTKLNLQSKLYEKWWPEIFCWKCSDRKGWQEKAINSQRCQKMTNSHRGENGRRKLSSGGKDF